MLISRAWLQSHFETELPDAQKIADTLMLHSFEIEGIEKKGDDHVIDIDVLPNRAHDCLSYAGVAREYSALTGFNLKQERYHYHENILTSESAISVTIDNPEQCYRYMARVINNVNVAESPEWLRERITSIGQRSINNIVDITNYVMFDTGNPMHAFDADKIVGGITIRNATEGESMTTLSGEELVLHVTDLVIADEEGILALAGVKGGTKADVDSNTKNIVLEVANFNPTTTRSTARRVKILTDASKRFENEISSELAAGAMESVSRLVSDCAHTDTIELGGVSDVYPNPEKKRSVNVTLKHVQSLLGLEISAEEVDIIFDRLDYQTHFQNETYTVHIPVNRLDLNIAEDIIEEIGRIYGYHNITAKSLDGYRFTPNVNKNVFVEQTLRNFLVGKRFSDVMTYSFVKKGEIEMFNPIAADKKALRKNLHKQINESLEKNLRNVDYYGIDQVKLFEIDHIYTKNGEEIMCSIGIANNGKSAKKKYGTELAQLESLRQEMNDIFSMDIAFEIESNTLNFSVTKIVSSIETPDSYGQLFSDVTYSEEARFHQVSVYPFITRDVSFWASGEVSRESLEQTISDVDALYLKKVFLFDTFEKEGRISYAFSLVFQSDDKTLLDADVDTDMKLIISRLEEIGSEMR